MADTNEASDVSVRTASPPVGEDSQVDALIAIFPDSDRETLASVLAGADNNLQQAVEVLLGMCSFIL